MMPWPMLDAVLPQTEMQELFLRVECPDRDDLIVSNCADCGVELLCNLRQFLRWKLHHPEALMVFTRVHGRPFCYGCIARPLPPP